MSLPEILRGCLVVPAIASPLFIISNPDLVIAQCTAGVVGSFPSLNARPAEKLEDWFKKITGELGEWDAAHPDRPAAPYAVNQIVHRSNNRLMHDLELCVKYKAPIVITSLGYYQQRVCPEGRGKRRGRADRGGGRGRGPCRGDLAFRADPGDPRMV
jgi:nitronate monooxygenase